jgi:hypothetical protein
MPMTPAAAKKYKPRRTPGSQDEVIYPETRAKIQEAKAEAADRKAAADNEAAYDLSSRVSMGDLYEKKAKGGSVGSASKRADGIASRGKTNCKMY